MSLAFGQRFSKVLFVYKKIVTMRVERLTSDDRNLVRNLRILNIDISHLGATLYVIKIITYNQSQYTRSYASN